jgi:hypothetical protein
MSGKAFAEDGHGHLRHESTTLLDGAIFVKAWASRREAIPPSRLFIAQPILRIAASGA